jgi:uncharacterized protein YjeT (DUF2065 family)
MLLNNLLLNLSTMNDTTLFLSQLIGPVAIVIGLSVLIRHDAYMEFIRNLAKNRSLLLYNGMIESTAGLAIVLNHNLWSTAAEVIISLIGWGMVAEGVFDLFVSKTTIKDMAHSSVGILKVTGLVTVLVGAYLVYVGYFI